MKQDNRDASQQYGEPTLRGGEASCTSDWFHALQKSGEENLTAFDHNEVVSVDPSSVPRISLDPAVTVQTPTDE